ncbi:MAG TPA: transcriptional regulator NrdR [Candidatus Thermoplasmatota archaeon]|nr:transcriptional regulator NrdR [Candidatus Thermoplasmatota archaeon]
MRCPYCRSRDSRVVESRDADDGSAVRRRRECGSCRKRFTTYERVTSAPIYVRKRDGAIEPFDRTKILRGVQTACRQRPVTPEAIEKLVEAVEREIRTRESTEVSSGDVGESVARRLKDLDKVAFIRFASVYKRFDDLDQFVREIQAVDKDAR